MRQLPKKAEAHAGLTPLPPVPGVSHKGAGGGMCLERKGAGCKQAYTKSMLCRWGLELLILCHPPRQDLCVL